MKKQFEKIVGTSEDVCCFCGCSCCVAIVLGTIVGFIVLMCSIVSLGPEEQVIIYGPNSRYERNGPATLLVSPARKKLHRNAIRLGNMQYAVVKDAMTGQYRHESGPQLLFLKAYDEKEAILTKVVLQKHEYARYVATLSGIERVVAGPASFVPEPLEVAPNGTEKAIVLGTDLAVLTLNKTSGHKRLVTDGGVFIPAPYEVILEVRRATLMSIEQYAVVNNLLTGALRHEPGPQLFQPGAYDQLIGLRRKLVLEKDQYVRLMDEESGIERIVRGPQTFMPHPSEVYPQGVMRATFLDSDTAVLVRNVTSGQERLHIHRGVYFPQPEETILEIRKLIRVLPHETMVVRDDRGVVTVHSGSYNAQQSAFFLPPYSEVVEMAWSCYSDPLPASGPQSTKIVNFTAIDMRTRKMFFRYEVRTNDNVKLKLEGTIFWAVKDVPRMINVTSDPEGDIWYHARSALIQAVSQVTLQTFMTKFNNITMEAFNAQSIDGFYSARGVKLESMELTKYECVDSQTSAILQQIIQESTNRIKRLQIQQGENEVKAAALSANITLERQKTQFIMTLAANKRLESKTQGEAAGTSLMRAADSFISGLNDTVENVTNRVELYKLHETLKSKNTDTKYLATGKADLFLTPNNVNLKLQMGGANGASQRRLDEYVGVQQEEIETELQEL